MDFTVMKRHCVGWQRQIFGVGNVFDKIKISSGMAERMWIEEVGFFTMEVY